MRRRSRSVRGIVLVLQAALWGVACNDSPTEPGGAPSAAVITLTAAAAPVISDVGTLTLTSAVCTCTLAPLIVTINGAAAGTMPCSAKQAFPMPRMEAGTARYVIVVTNGLGATGVMSFDVSSDAPGAPSLAVQALCP